MTPDVMKASVDRAAPLEVAVTRELFIVKHLPSPEANPESFS
jgi:hypothetical protein